MLLWLGWGSAAAFTVLGLLLLTPFHRFLLLLVSQWDKDHLFENTNQQAGIALSIFLLLEENSSLTLSLGFLRLEK